MTPATRSTCLIVMLSIFGSTAAAQQHHQAALGNSWSHGTTLGATVGVATDAEATGAMAGVLMGWEMRPTFSIEGSASWLDRGPGNDAFTASLAAKMCLGGTRPVVAFAAGGFGLYHYSTGPNSTGVPGFYADRMADTPGGGNGRVGHSFTDPAFTLGAGLDLHLSRHIVIRPDVTGIFAFTSSAIHAVPVVGVHFVYHFEDHPVTP